MVVTSSVHLYEQLGHVLLLAQALILELKSANFSFPE